MSEILRTCTATTLRMHARLIIYLHVHVPGRNYQDPTAVESYSDMYYIQQLVAERDVVVLYILQIHVRSTSQLVVHVVRSNLSYYSCTCRILHVRVVGSQLGSSSLKSRTTRRSYFLGVFFNKCDRLVSYRAWNPFFRRKILTEFLVYSTVLQNLHVLFS